MTKFYVARDGFGNVGKCHSRLTPYFDTIEKAKEEAHRLRFHYEKLYIKSFNRPSKYQVIETI